MLYVDKEKIGNYFFVLAILHTLFYTTMYALNIYGFSRIVAVFSIPLLMFAYFFKSVKVDYVYLFSLLLVLVGDVTNSFWIEKYDWSVFLYGINLGFYSYYLLKEMGDNLTSTRILIPAIPYSIIYFYVFYSLVDNMDGMTLGTVLFYNFFLGLFSVCTWIKLIYERSRSSFYLFISSSSAILMSIAYLFNKSLEKLKVIDDVIINFLFLFFHVAMFLYIIRKEKEKYGVSKNE
ncbi:hypothetical protein [Neptunitalea lumnitzerae]|uniref:YhhN-like protein n=1 Tax=Neptunitalea lumnitzerae TaxID=2965509 RepID=A0ABQ5MK08_9FLAO|nr:hypothetical protein [Neptunitalea sp. Y10]GLB49753.1 hypothetical protein Y10_21210 [Neptunitalea sp. Y10]